MPTPNLLKIYRQNESESRALYEQLYQSPLTHKIGIELRHLNASRRRHKPSGKLRRSYTVYHRFSMADSEKYYARP